MTNTTFVPPQDLQERGIPDMLARWAPELLEGEKEPQYTPHPMDQYLEGTLPGAGVICAWALPALVLLAHWSAAFPAVQPCAASLPCHAGSLSKQPDAFQQVSAAPGVKTPKH